MEPIHVETAERLIHFCPLGKLVVKVREGDRWRVVAYYKGAPKRMRKLFEEELKNVHTD